MAPDDGAATSKILFHCSEQSFRLGGEHHFMNQRRLVAQGWQLLVPDRPGHGRSPDPGRPDDADANGELVSDLLPRVGVHLVGHSFGGCVALAAAIKRPKLIRSLTIIEPAMAALEMDKPVVRRFGFKILNVLFLPLSALSRIKRFMKVVNIPDDIGGASSDEELDRMGRAIQKLKLPSNNVLARQLHAVRHAGILVLVESGGWSPAFDAISDSVADAVGGPRLVIPSPHHFPQQVSDEFDDTLIHFMRESDARRQ